jgi:hypothetical protein
MALNVDESIKMIQELWRQDTTATVTSDIAKTYFAKAVIHVEALDYRKENVWTSTNNNVVFTTAPTDISYLLYIYKALELMSRAIVSDDINDSNLGIAWRSGMDSMSTATAGRIKQTLYEGFKKQYEEVLTTAKLNSHTPERSNLYGSFGVKEQT